MPDANPPARGLIDTSMWIDWELIDIAQRPTHGSISTLTLAELAAGPHAAGDDQTRATRMERLVRAEATFEPLPFDVNAARAYGRIYAAQVAAGRKARGPRTVDLLIAAVAVSNGLDLYTRNPEDFTGVSHLVKVVGVDLR